MCIFHNCVVFAAGLDEQAKIDKIKELLLSLPRPIIVVMRFLFAFLNQYVNTLKIHKYIRPWFISSNRVLCFETQCLN